MDRPAHQSPHHFARFLRRCWQEALLDYRDAGEPFGSTSRGFDLWIRYCTRTTLN